MRHGKKVNSLSRKSEHRKAMFSNLAKSLITHKRIQTTLAKAKALRKYVEPLITKAKYDSTHSRRTVFSYLQDKEAVKELFITVADKVGDRPGGYTRIIKLGPRVGDGAETAMIELVDFNENLLEEQQKSTRRRRRRRRRGGSSSSDENTTQEEQRQDNEEQHSSTEEENEASRNDDSQNNSDDDGESENKNKS
jgi:large subunit ribosomal protein L17